MQPDEIRAFVLAYRSLEGRKVVDFLQVKLQDMDRNSRKLRGDALVENTIKRDTYADIIDMFVNAEKRENKKEGVAWF